MSVPPRDCARAPPPRARRRVRTPPRRRRAATEREHLDELQERLVTATSRGNAPRRHGVGTSTRCGPPNVDNPRARARGKTFRWLEHLRSILPPSSTPRARRERLYERAGDELRPRATPTPPHRSRAGACDAPRLAENRPLVTANGGAGALPRPVARPSSRRSRRAGWGTAARGDARGIRSAPSPRLAGTIDRSCRHEVDAQTRRRDARTQRATLVVPGRRGRAADVADAAAPPPGGGAARRRARAATRAELATRALEGAALAAASARDEARLPSRRGPALAAWPAAVGADATSTAVAHPRPRRSSRASGERAGRVRGTSKARDGAAVLERARTAHGNSPERRHPRMSSCAGARARGRPSRYRRRMQAKRDCRATLIGRAIEARPRDAVGPPPRPPPRPRAPRRMRRPPPAPGQGEFPPRRLPKHGGAPSSSATDAPGARGRRASRRGPRSAKETNAAPRHEAEAGAADLRRETSRSWPIRRMRPRSDDDGGTCAYTRGAGQPRGSGGRAEAPASALSWRSAGNLRASEDTRRAVGVDPVGWSARRSAGEEGCSSAAVNATILEAFWRADPAMSSFVRDKYVDLHAPRDGERRRSAGRPPLYSAVAGGRLRRGLPLCPTRPRRRAPDGSPHRPCGAKDVSGGWDDPDRRHDRGLYRARPRPLVHDDSRAVHQRTCRERGQPWRSRASPHPRASAIRRRRRVRPRRDAARHTALAARLPPRRASSPRGALPPSRISIAATCGDRATAGPRPSRPRSAAARRPRATELAPARADQLRRTKLRVRRAFCPHARL